MYLAQIQTPKDNVDFVSSSLDDIIAQFDGVIGPRVLVIRDVKSIDDIISHDKSNENKD